MSHPFKLNFSLKQHTPIIHFQYDQVGATLRATEVKPKLDQFLIQTFKENKIEYKHFISDKTVKTNPPLDYKIRIFSKLKQIEVIKKKDRNIPLFFGNMGTDYEPRGLVTNSDTQVSIFCLNPELKKHIAGRINAFFCSANFGMRTSKGFGSFTTDNEFTAPANALSFSVDSTDWKTVFSTIDLFYKSIRGGINGAKNPSTNRFVSGIYMKPLIFIYAKDCGIKWEKKIIKEKSFARNLNEQDNRHRNKVNDHENWPLWVEEEQERIVRDMLGLSTDQSWKGYPRREDMAKIEKSDPNKKIERFASPITFKPIKNNRGYQVFFWATPVPQQYKTAKMNIKVNDRSIGNFDNWDTFDINHFFANYLNQTTVRNALQFNDRDRMQKELADKLISIYANIEHNR